MIYNSGRGRPEEATAKIVMIAKVGKVHIETTEGAKFRVKTLASTVRPSGFSSADELRAADDPAVLDALARAAATRVKAELYRLITSNTVLRGNDPAKLLADVTAIREAAVRVERMRARWSTRCRRAPARDARRTNTRTVHTVRVFVLR